MEIEKDQRDYLTIKIDYKNSISLLNFKTSIDGWYNQYNKHLADQNISKEEDILLIKEIKQESIDLVLYSSAVIPLLSDFSTIYTFYTAVKHTISWLSSKKGKKPKYSIEELENIKDMLAPVNSPDKAISYYINGDNNTVQHIDHVTVKVIRNNIDEELKTLSVKDAQEPVPDKSIREKVLLKFTQIENAAKNTRSTKGIIADIDSKPHPIMFEEGLKQQIIHSLDNPHIMKYLVDVKLHMLNNEINTYTILKNIDHSLDDNFDQSENSLFPEDT